MREKVKEKLERGRRKKGGEEKSNGRNLSFYVDFSGDSFSKKKFKGRTLFWLWRYSRIQLDIYIFLTLLTNRNLMEKDIL